MQCSRCCISASAWQRKYIDHFNTKGWVDAIAKANKIKAQYCETRWTSMNNSINKIKRFIPPLNQVSQEHLTHWEHIYQDSEIIRIFTHAVQTVEGDFVDLLKVKRTVDNIIQQLRAIKNMEGNQPSRVTFMLDILEERKEKNMSSHYQIADFLQVLDPQSPDTYQEFRDKCVSTGLLMNNQYLQGGALELYKQRNTRNMVERAIVIGTKLGNKFDNYIHYLEHVWQDNPMIMDFLQQVAVLAQPQQNVFSHFSTDKRLTFYVELSVQKH
ncbi:Conserved_hypothetical protein [Hexamita inflata]|uniref:Uncharacterized protein n=1 Tax=Hexamita inflata TaxID=28002 RepID=A0AA86QIX9_9EUKA|nr:Conserved hypothetical protein [Hexamita inflata]